MRLILPVLLFLASGLDRDAAAAEMAATCPTSPLPAEASRTEKEQLDLLSKQATACVKDGKPARAVALLPD